MSVSREDLLSAAEDDCNERFLELITKHVRSCLYQLKVHLRRCCSQAWALS